MEPDRFKHKKLAKRWARPYLGALCVWLLSTYAVIFIRLPFIKNNAVFNPDEADLLVAGRRAALSVIPYDRFTTTTYGPIWPMFLGLLNRLGFQLSLVGGHLLSAVFLSALVSTQYLISKKVISRSVAAILFLVCLIVWAYVPNSSRLDFYQLSTESLPVVLCSIAMLVYAHNPTMKNANLSCFVLGIATLAKYQFAPIAFFAFLIVSSTARVGGRRLRFGRLQNLLFLVSPGIIILTGALLGGKHDRIFSEAIPAVLNYSNNDGPPLTVRFTQLLRFVRDYWWYFSPWVVVFVSSASIRYESKRSAFGTFSRLLLALVIPILSVGASPYLFAHYALIFSMSGPLAALVLLTSVKSRARYQIRSRDLRPDMLLVLGLVLYFLPMSAQLARERLPLEHPKSLVSDISEAFRATTAFNSSSELTKVCPSGAKVVLWGWAAEHYLWNGWQPASRFTISAWLVAAPNKQHFQEELFSEILEERPKCVINAVGPGFFIFSDASWSLSTRAPRLHTLLLQDYDLRKIEYGSIEVEGITKPRLLNVYVLRVAKDVSPGAWAPSFFPL